MRPAIVTLVDTAGQGPPQRERASLELAELLRISTDGSFVASPAWSSAVITTAVGDVAQGGTSSSRSHQHQHQHQHQHRHHLQHQHLPLARQACSAPLARAQAQLLVEILRFQGDGADAGRARRGLFLRTMAEHIAPHEPALLAAPPDRSLFFALLQHVTASSSPSSSSSTASSSSSSSPTPFGLVFVEQLMEEASGLFFFALDGLLSHSKHAGGGSAAAAAAAASASAGAGGAAGASGPIMGSAAAAPINGGAGVTRAVVESVRFLTNVVEQSPEALFRGRPASALNCAASAIVGLLASAQTAQNTGLHVSILRLVATLARSGRQQVDGDGRCTGTAASAATSSSSSSSSSSSPFSSSPSTRLAIAEGLLVLRHPMSLSLVLKHLISASAAGQPRPTWAGAGAAAEAEARDSVQLQAARCSTTLAECVPAASRDFIDHGVSEFVLETLMKASGERDQQQRDQLIEHALLELLSRLVRDPSFHSDQHHELEALATQDKTLLLLQRSCGVQEDDRTSLNQGKSAASATTNLDRRSGSGGGGGGGGGGYSAAIFCPVDPPPPDTDPERILLLVQILRGIAAKPGAPGTRGFIDALIQIAEHLHGMVSYGGDHDGPQQEIYRVQIGAELCALLSIVLENPPSSGGGGGGGGGGSGYHGDSVHGGHDISRLLDVAQKSCEMLLLQVSPAVSSRGWHLQSCKPQLVSALCCLVGQILRMAPQDHSSLVESRVCAMCKDIFNSSAALLLQSASTAASFGSLLLSVLDRLNRYDDRVPTAVRSVVRDTRTEQFLRESLEFAVVTAIRYSTDQSIESIVVPLATKLFVFLRLTSSVATATSWSSWLSSSDAKRALLGQKNIDSAASFGLSTTHGHVTNAALVGNIFRLSHEARELPDAASTGTTPGAIQVSIAVLYQRIVVGSGPNGVAGGGELLSDSLNQALWAVLGLAKVQCEPPVARSNEVPGSHGGGRPATRALWPIRTVKQIVALAARCSTLHQCDASTAAAAAVIGAGTADRGQASEDWKNWQSNLAELVSATEGGHHLPQYIYDDRQTCLLPWPAISPCFDGIVATWLWNIPALELFNARAISRVLLMSCPTIPQAPWSSTDIVLVATASPSSNRGVEEGLWKSLCRSRDGLHVVVSHLMSLDGILNATQAAAAADDHQIGNGSDEYLSDAVAPHPTRFRVLWRAHRTFQAVFHLLASSSSKDDDERHILWPQVLRPSQFSLMLRVKQICANEIREAERGSTSRDSDRGGGSAGGADTSGGDATRTETACGPFFASTVLPAIIDTSSCVLHQAKVDRAYYASVAFQIIKFLTMGGDDLWGSAVGLRHSPMLTISCLNFLNLLLQRCVRPVVPSSGTEQHHGGAAGGGAWEAGGALDRFAGETRFVVDSTLSSVFRSIMDSVGVCQRACECVTSATKPDHAVLVSIQHLLQRALFREVRAALDNASFHDSGGEGKADSGAPQPPLVQASVIPMEVFVEQLLAPAADPLLAAASARLLALQFQADCLVMRRRLSATPGLRPGEPLGSSSPSSSSSSTSSSTTTTIVTTWASSLDRGSLGVLRLVQFRLLDLSTRSSKAVRDAAGLASNALYAYANRHAPEMAPCIFLRSPWAQTLVSSALKQYCGGACTSNCAGGGGGGGARGEERGANGWRGEQDAASAVHLPLLLQVVNWNPAWLQPVRCDLARNLVHGLASIGDLRQYPSSGSVLLSRLALLLQFARCGWLDDLCASADPVMRQLGAWLEARSNNCDHGGGGSSTSGDGNDGLHGDDSDDTKAGRSHLHQLAASMLSAASRISAGSDSTVLLHAPRRARRHFTEYGGLVIAPPPPSLPLVERLRARQRQQAGPAGAQSSRVNRHHAGRGAGSVPQAAALGGGGGGGSGRGSRKRSRGQQQEEASGATTQQQEAGAAGRLLLPDDIHRRCSECLLVRLARGELEQQGIALLLEMLRCWLKAQGSPGAVGVQQQRGGGTGVKAPRRST